MNEVFDQAFLRKLEYLYTLSRRVSTRRVYPRRFSRKVGAGLQFADHRHYTPGDDPRYLDWNVVGRMDRLLLRLFEEEEDLHLYILLDVSGSMGVEGGRLLEYAGRVAAALAYVGLASLDRVGLISFADDVRRTFPPVRGRRWIYPIFDFLSSLQPGGGTSLVRAADTFLAGSCRRGQVVLLSDFLDPVGLETALKRLVGAGFGVFAIQVYLPWGISGGGDGDGRGLPTGEATLVDAETGRTLSVSLTPASHRRYRAHLERYRCSLARLCLSCGVGFVSAAVVEPFERTVLEVFRRGGILW